MSVLVHLKKDLQKHASSKRAEVLKNFFKTKKGEYGEGDIFIGVTVPTARKIARRYQNISLSAIHNLLQSKIHEERLVALLILVQRFSSATLVERARITKFYLANIGKVNNWDLVDLSADKILGCYLLRRSRRVLYSLAKSSNLWERRIAIIATFAFIKDNDFIDTLRLSFILLKDPHDLINKAVGWMLREVGKRSRREEEIFLKKHYLSMPRVTLRYAIEHFSPVERVKYLKGLI